MSNFVKFLSFSLFLLICITWCSAQTKILRQLKGLPSTEVYDVLADSKGFLWVAHNAGISKYDGISFTNFSSPLQSSLGTTNLLEDKHGRIWFINFTGQIFYIENGHMTLLSAYKSEAERVFPRIGLLNNLLIATSKNGLFICDVNTLKCHYEHCISSPDKGTTSLSILKDKVLAYNSVGDWFIYQPGKGLKLIVLKDRDKTNNGWPIRSNSSTLCSASCNDTSLMYSNPSNVFYKLLVANDTVKIYEQRQFNSFINTVSVVKNNYWINSITSTIPGRGRTESITGHNISCMTVDKEGHYWYGSLQHGLLTDSINTITAPSNCIFYAKKGDLIKCLVKNGDILLLGTQGGALISYNTVTNTSTQLINLPANHGGIYYLKLLKDGDVLIGSAVYTYIFNIKSRRLKPIDPVRALKQADQINGALVVASSNSMIVLPDKDDPPSIDAFKKKFKGLVDRKYDVFGNKFRILYIQKRCRAICYSPVNQTLWVSFKDGLYKINSLGVNSFYLNRLPVYASCLTAYADKIIVGTFNSGIMIIEGNNIRHLTSDDGLLSNNIVSVKIIENKLWAFTSGAVQIFNLTTLKLIYKYPFPGINNAFLIDADEVKGNCYFTAVNGLYKILPVQKKNDSISIYINSLFINRKDTGVVDNLSLPYSRNDIQISLGTPYLLNARDIVIKYRLKGNDSTLGFYGRPGERNFHFVSLMPGHYQFEALAIKPQTGLSSKPFIMNFTIRPPWWQTWWFRTISILVCLAIITTILRIYYINKLNQQKLQFEKKLIVEKERQHISREIHDHIGQALSVIKLNLNMNNASEMADAKEMISEVIQDMRQFTHGLYYGKLLTGSLTDVIKKDVERLNIDDRLKASLDINMTGRMTDEHSELLIYRIFQEAINNILKHAYAKNITVKLSSNQKQFKLTIIDDGIGFSEKAMKKGMGINSMHTRAELLNADLIISGKPNEGCEVELVINYA